MSIEIIVKDSSEESFKKAYATFKKTINKEGLLREVRERRYFKKPSVKKREKKNASIRKHSRDENKNFDY